MIHRVLLVEDSLADARIVHRHLRAASSETGSWRLERVGALAPAIDRLGKRNLDIVLLDLGLPDSDGLETLARLREADPKTPVVVWAEGGDDALGVRALELGAEDFLVKDDVATPVALARALRHAIVRNRIGVQREARAQRVAGAQRMESLWIVAAGAGRAYDRLLDKILEEIDLCFECAGRRLDAVERAHLTKIRSSALEGETLGARLRCLAEGGPGAIGVDRIEPRGTGVPVWLPIGRAAPSPE